MRAEAKGKSASVESCGLNVINRMSAPDEALAMATKFGLDLGGHLSRGWEACKFEDADLILAMEFWQYRKLVELFPHKKVNIRLLREFAPFPENLLCNINDPFGQTKEIFEECFRQIQRSIQALNARI
jgi:protein-tyrosine phosphatase